ncbi:MAG: RNA polymerase sigma-70 factor [Chryseolinea sp.]
MNESDIHDLNNADQRNTRDGRDAKMIDEEALVKLVFDKDPKQGCEILFQKYYRVLCSHAVRFVHSKEVAEDIVSELFCKFWTDQVYLSINTSYRAYLFKAVRFSAYNYIRWELSKRKKEFDFHGLIDEINSLKPEESMLVDELAEEIDRVIENLPNQCKRVFMLSRYENKKYREIAEELNISQKAVEGHISKALESLRTNLKKSDLLTLLLIGYFLNL